MADKLKTKPKSAPVSTKSGTGLLGQISTITALVQKHLGRFEGRYQIVRDPKTLAEYIDACILNGEAAIDTETDSLDPITCTLAGLSLYTPGQPAIYVPVNHINYITNQPLDDQMPISAITAELGRAEAAKIRWILYNAKFDTRVLMNQAQIRLTPYWDGYLAARLLNENEPENGLKAIHKKYCDEGSDEAFSYDSLFSGIPFTKIPITTGYLYAARDAEITYEVYQFQAPYLDPEDPLCQDHALEGVAKLYREIEIPLVEVVADMEQTGVALDLTTAKALSEKYNAKLKTILTDSFDTMTEFGPKLDEYRRKQGANNKLEYPVNLGSPTQVAIMLYDILGIKPVDPKRPRSTDEAALSGIDHPIAKAILEYRGVSVLLKTFIDKLPTMLNPKTKRLHGSFNQIGADTGRFSSSEPNLQNIPSHVDDIRTMFVASPGYVLLSSDYSAQEPRIAAHLSQDQKMIQAYRDGKDLYAEIASIVHNVPYEECREVRPDGTKNPDGKARRSEAKAIVLGILYGKGVPAIAEDLGITKQKAQQVYDKVLLSFPGLKKLMDESEDMARTKGYVTTIWGRKRRLPNMQLDRYEFSLSPDYADASFDPMFDAESSMPTEVSQSQIAKYTKLLNAARGYRDREAIITKAKAEGILIKDNSGYIAEAKRQTVNSRVQGSAADQTKKAMILVHRDPPMREWGFRLVLAVHDELIGECPEENASKVAKRFSDLMVEAAKELVVPSKCDVEVSYCWYGESLHLD